MLKLLTQAIFAGKLLWVSGNEGQSQARDFCEALREGSGQGVGGRRLSY